MCKQKNNNVLIWPSGSLDFSNGCIVMGILNVTPDSFSDGGDFLDADTAVKQAVKMAAYGASIIDIGPESTRPGAEKVSPQEQIKRAVPVIEKITSQINIPISIDTQNYEVAKAALDAGASIINDITALSCDKMAGLAAERGVPVVLMHMQGRPETMQAEPKYDDVVGEVLEYLLEKAREAEKRGVKKEMIFLDPGIGFGKTTEHNIQLLKNIGRFVETGYRILLGTSRKKFLGVITGKTEPKDRIFATAATVAIAVSQGVSVARVHDIGEMVDVIKTINKIYR
ncbi:MAG: dihydropteroate synthase [Anaerohalosphaeraceae bacterium]|nr:dihydropteroate synthase [Anaerohalosphaeraceae bacterium]